jgi:hypothetical protein
MIGSVKNGSDFSDPDDNPGESVYTPAFIWNSMDMKYDQTTHLNETGGYFIVVFNPCDLTVSDQNAQQGKTKRAELSQAFIKKHGQNPPPPPAVNWDAETIRQIPKEYGLSQNYPNPFNPETTIGYQISQTGNVRLIIYNTMGQAVRMLVDGHQNPGSYEAVWDGKDENGLTLGSGMYLVRMEAGKFTSMRKVVMMK